MASSIATRANSTAGFQATRKAPAPRRNLVVRASADPIKAGAATAMAAAVVLGQASFGAGPVIAAPSLDNAPAHTLVLNSASLNAATRNIARDAGRGASDLGSDAADAVSNAGGNVADAVSGAVNDAAGSVKDAAKDAARQVNIGSNPADKLASNVKSAARQVNIGSNPADKLVGNAKDAARQVSNKADSASSGGFGKIKQIGRQATGNTAGDKLQRNVSRAGDKASDAASDAASSAKRGLFGAKQSAVNAADDAGASVKNASRGIFGQTFTLKNVSNKVSNAADDVSSKASGAARDLKRSVNNSGDDVTGNLQNVAGDAKDKAKGLVRAVTNGTADASSLIKEANQRATASRDAAPSGPFDVFRGAEEQAGRAARAVEEAARPAIQQTRSTPGDDVAASVMDVGRRFAGKSATTDGSGGDPEKAIMATESNTAAPGRYQGGAEGRDGAL